jgi:hypothetical protein
MAHTQVATPASVRGVVYDSISKSPLGGATVQFTALSAELAGRAFSAQSEANGAFAVSGIPAGKYAVGFYHPSLDTLGIEAPIVTLEVTSGSHRVNLATPSPRSLMKSLCPEGEEADSTMVFGHVRETSTNAALEGASVTVEWSETVIDARGIRSRDRIGHAETQGPGWFAICHVAGDLPLLMRASHDADSSGYVDVVVPAGGVRHVTFYVGGATLIPSPGIDTAAMIRQGIAFPRMWTGKSRLTGVVTDAQKKPVANAHVLVWDAGPEAVTNDQGRFSFDALPGGTHTVEVKAIGYTPNESVVHLSPENPSEQQFSIGDQAQVLPTVTVGARANIVYNKKLVEYQRHRLHSFGGKFLSPEDLDRRPAAPPSSLLQDFPGVMVSHQQGVTLVSMKSFRATIDRESFDAARRDFVGCTPTLYVDGFRSLLDFDAFDSFYRSDELLAVEVYTREMERPQEFQDMTSPCGAVVFWTRAAPVNPKKIKGLKPPPSPPAW